MLRLSRKEEKTIIMRISRSEMKQVNRFICPESVVEKNDKIQNEINKKIKKTSQFYHLIKSTLWNKGTESKKPQYTRCTLRKYYYMEQKH
jgi:hypothetical protein